MITNKSLRIIFFLLPVLFFSIFVFNAQAHTGTITSGYEQSTFLDQDLDSDTFDDVINWRTTNGTAISVTDTALTGNLWGETVGWIKLNPSGNTGVVNNGSGILSGYAWGENTGWINFGPFLNSSTTQVTINTSTGEFSGNAWAENYGWIEFDCPGADTAADADAYADTCVKTDWRIDQCSDSTDNDGDGLIDYPADTGCSSLTDDNETDPSHGGGSPDCSDNVDNDSDGFIDYPNDPGCTNSDDSSEVDPLVDFCPNINGIQTTIPDGYILQDGQCIIPPPEVDACPNISGIQIEIPDGYVLKNGQCIVLPIEEETCPPGTTGTFPDCVFPSPPEKSFCELNPNDPYCVNPPPKNPILIINPVRDFIEKTFYPVTVKKIDEGLKVAAIASVLFGGVLSVATMLFLNPLAIPELILIPFRLWALLLSALGLKKKIKPWGTVYDAVTKQPLDPVYVSLFDLEGKEVGSSITDIDGRYGFFVEPGVYKVVPKKTNYIFPSHALANNFQDELYHDLYFGDYLNISAGEMIVKNIPMDPINFDWNEFAKNKKQLLKYYSKKELLLSRISNWLFGFGFSVATVALVISPEKYNIVIFGLYVLMFILRRTRFKLRAKGRVVGSDGLPLSFAVVRIFAVQTNVEIAHKVTDKMGRYHMLVPNGTYYVKIEKKNDDGSYGIVHTSDYIKIVHGTLNKVFNI